MSDELSHAHKEVKEQQAGEDTIPEVHEETLAEASAENTTTSMLETWQHEAITTLLTSEPKDQQGKQVYLTQQRVYLHSDYYGDQVYHVVSLENGDLVIDQVDHREKYQQKVVLETQEITPLLRTLLQWYLQEHTPKPAQTQEASAEDSDDIDIGDLDEHPF